jgi:glycosyltransferase involved in cell wall biosynthesis
VDLRTFYPDRDNKTVLNEIGVSPGLPVVGHVARLDRWKGIDVFLRAASICHQQFPDARFLVVGGEIEGSTEYAKSLYQLAEDLGLRDVVQFTGWRYGPEEMPDVYPALDILVLASTSPEPFGLVLLEAMATAKPVIATNHGGPSEICVDGETALLIPPGDPGKLADAILTLLRNPETGKRMGLAGRKRVEEVFDHHRCVQAIEKVYQELLPEPG